MKKTLVLAAVIAAAALVACERKKKRLHPRLLRRPPLHPLPLHRHLKPQLLVRLLLPLLHRPLRLLLPPLLPALKPRSNNFCFLDFVEEKSHPRVAFFCGPKYAVETDCAASSRKAQQSLANSIT